jgi:hypothetical protein
MGWVIVRVRGEVEEGEIVKSPADGTAPIISGLKRSRSALELRHAGKMIRVILTDRLRWNPAWRRGKVRGQTTEVRCQM